MAEQEQAKAELEDRAQERSAPELDPVAAKKAFEEETAKAANYLSNWQKAEAALANYRKRAEQEKQESEGFANAMLIASLLPIMDDLERAFGNLDADLAGLTWIDGLKLVYRKLQGTLEAQGLSAIKTTGEGFDPRVHEAVLQIEGEEGKVLGELQKGYKFRDRVIRPAMVKVGRGKPEGGAAGSSSEPSDRP